MYVCLKQFSMTGRGFSNIHTRSRAPGKAFRYGKSTNCVCMFDLCMYVCLRHTYMLEGFKHTYIHTYIHTYMLGRLRHTYIHSWGSILNRPQEAQKIKFRAGSPECFKTLTETKVWTHFLVQAGYLSFGLQTYTLEGFKHTYIGRLKHTYIQSWGSILNRPPEVQKIKFRAGPPECFKTLTETKVWTYFLV